MRSDVSGVLGLSIFLWPMTLAIAQATPEQAQLILHLLDYVAVDYPQFVQDGTVLDQSEYDEQIEFAQQVRTLLDQLPVHSASPASAVRRSNSSRSFRTSVQVRGACPSAPLAYHPRL